MVRAVIIDDEMNAQDFIESVIRNNFPDIKVFEKAGSVVEGIKAITKHKPEIVFLDIEMNDGTGFDVLDALPEKNFDFIFITAYDQYAVKAFKYSAIDYIIKPIDVEELIPAIKKLIDNRSSTRESNKYEVLKENLQRKGATKLSVPCRKGLEYINLKDIVRFAADGRYTNIHLINGNSLTVSKSIGEYDDLIDEPYFYKPHKSFIININYVKKYLKQDGGSIIMEDGSEVLIARNKRDEFLEIMKLFSD